MNIRGACYTAQAGGLGIALDEARVDHADGCAFLLTEEGQIFPIDIGGLHHDMQIFRHAGVFPAPLQEAGEAFGRVFEDGMGRFFVLAEKRYIEFFERDVDTDIEFMNH